MTIYFINSALMLNDILCVILQRSYDDTLYDPEAET